MPKAALATKDKRSAALKRGANDVGREDSSDKSKKPKMEVMLPGS